MYFITSNKGKLAEAKSYLGKDVRQKRMKVPEIQSSSLKEIAKHSAAYAYEKVGAPLFVEDSGLFINGLGGFPGPYSRFVFETVGCGGVLRLLEGSGDRGAYFQAVVAYADGGGRIQTFEGRVDGAIAMQKAGSSGFGFDPIFVPEEREKTFAQDPAYKMAVSHRIRALRSFSRYLKKKGL